MVELLTGSVAVLAMIAFHVLMVRSLRAELAQTRDDRDTRTAMEAHMGRRIAALEAANAEQRDTIAMLRGQLIAATDPEKAKAMIAEVGHLMIDLVHGPGAALQTQQAQQAPGEWDERDIAEEEPEVVFDIGDLDDFDEIESGLSRVFGGGVSVPEEFDL